MNNIAPSKRLSLRAFLLRYLVRLFVRPALIAQPVQKSRQLLEKVAGLIWLASGSKLTFGKLGGVSAEWMANPTAGARGFVLYLHGGGYVTGSPKTHRALTSRIAKAARVCVVSPDYRLAPEHPHPAAVDDAVAAYEALLHQDIPANKIIIAGDSAGGGLALATALRLKDVPLPQPAGIVLLSPWTDMTLSGASMQVAQHPEWLLTHGFVADAARHYLAGQDARQATASPLFADLSGLAPLFVQVGTDEILLDDATRLAQSATALGTSVTLQIWPRLWHVWQLHGGQIPEADQAISAMAGFIHGRLTGKL